jgi:uncharacterized RDD family membrane protein YckC
MYCGECGGSYPVQDLARFGNHFVCLNCKPAYVQRMREGVQPVGATMAGAHYGGFWIRFLAIVIDGLILSVVTVPLAVILVMGSGGIKFDPQNPESIGKIFAIEAAVGLFSLVVGLLYQGYFVSRKGGTPGKLALGLKIVNALDGSYLSVGKAIGRYFAYILSGIVLYIGYIIAAFDSEKRALHDHICATRVIYKR